MPKFTFLLFFFVLISTVFSIKSQAQSPPNGINYQAIVRDNTGAEVPSSAVIFRFTIRSGSVAGAIMYQETQNTVTNMYGLVTLVIGQGTPTVSSPATSLTQLNWLNNSVFVNVETSIGASPFSAMGSSQYLSVPYSFVSGTAISVSGGNVNAVNLDIVNKIKFQSLNQNGAVLTVDGSGNLGMGYITSGATYTAGSGISITGSNQIINTGGTSGNVTLTGIGTTILGSGTSNATIVGQKLVAGSNITITGNTINAAAPTGLTAGSNVTISGNVISVAAPLTAGSNITITGNTINAAASAASPLTSLAGVGGIIVTGSSNNFSISGSAFITSIIGTGSAIVTKSGSLYTIAGIPSQWQNNGQAIYYNTSFVGIGTSNPVSTLDVNGGVSIGAYAGINPAPFNGLIASGLVGFGTTSPGFQLHVVGYNPSIAIEETGTQNANLIFRRGGMDKWYLLQNFQSPTDNIAFYDNFSGSKVFQINPGGNVGIGTETPLSKLDVNGGAAIGAYAGVSAAPADGLIVSGNVGIGTSIASRQLVVNVGSSSQNGIRISNPTIVSSGFELLIDGPANNDAYVWNWENASMYFGTNNGYRMKIDAAGNVGINTINPNATLDVNGFTKLGDAAVKVAYFTGTTSSSQGGSTSVSIGSISAAKILSISVMVDYSNTNSFLSSRYNGNPGYDFTWYQNGNTITVLNSTSGTNGGLGSGSILSKPIRVVVTYGP